jgi:hypothetical protein
MGWSLKEGAHEKNTDGELCVMEAVAYVAGRPWSDAPPCVCPVLGAFMRSWNDGLPSDADRDRLLKPFIPKLIGTKATKKIEERRAFMAMDWTIRVFTPKWLELTPALLPHATALRNLEEVADLAGLVAAGELLQKARVDAAAAWDAAWDAARAAAWDAAWAAAWAAARDAAWDAAWAAAWDAAWDAARAAAWDALKPTTEWLQVSACDLVDRMIAVAPTPKVVKVAA